jgi:hypothetical protein
LKNNFSVDATLGYANLGYDTTRTDPSNAEIFSGDTNADRYFGSAVMRYNKRQKKSKGTLSYGFSVGSSYTHESKDSYTETGSNGVNTALVSAQRTRIGQAQVGVTTG